MYTEYRIVWVDPNNSPDIVEEVFDDCIEDIEDAKDALDRAQYFADTSCWIPRMQRVTKEFV